MTRQYKIDGVGEVILLKYDPKKLYENYGDTFFGNPQDVLEFIRLLENETAEFYDLPKDGKFTFKEKNIVKTFFVSQVINEYPNIPGVWDKYITQRKQYQPTITDDIYIVARDKKTLERLKILVNVANDEEFVENIKGTPIKVILDVKEKCKKIFDETEIADTLFMKATYEEYFPTFSEKEIYNKNNTINQKKLLEFQRNIEAYTLFEKTKKLFEK